MSVNSLHLLTATIALTMTIAIVLSSSVAVVNLDQEPNNNEYPNSVEPFLPESDTGIWIRHRLCPQIPFEALPYYRFHLITRNCYEVGSVGPCGQNMVFVKEPLTKAIGKCVCRMDNRNGLGRPLLRDPVTDECYLIYSQAYCAEGEWLIVSPDNPNVPACVPNPCYRSYGYQITPSDEDQSAGAGGALNGTNSMATDDNDTDTNTTLINSTSASVINMSTSRNISIVMTNRSATAAIEPDTSDNGSYDDGFATIDIVEYMYFNGSCSLLNAPSENCDSDEILTFVHGKLACSNVNETMNTISTVISRNGNNEDENQIYL